MSSQSPFFSQDVAPGDAMDAWFCMLNSMVNFLSAASTLATKLEQNYLLSNVTQVRRPPFPLLCAPPHCKLKDEDNVEIIVKNDVSESTTADVCSVLPEETSLSPLQAESEHQGEASDLMQEVRYINTQEKGDGASIDAKEDDIDSVCEEEQSVVDDIQDISCGDQPEETIKICDSEDTVYFDDFTDSDQTADSLNLKKPSEEVPEVTTSQAPSVEKDEYFSSSSFVENKSVQAKSKNENVSRSSKSKVKSIKSAEIQTNSTSRFKSTVRALITKSPELQQSIKDSIISHHPTADEKTMEKVVNGKEKGPCRIPKNLNELKEQLDSIKNVSNSKATLSGNKKSSQKTSKIPIDKTTPRRIKKTEKQPSNMTVTSSCSSNVPLKSPGTSKRFASVESVVKKLIHSTNIVERSIDQTKENKKICAALQRKICKQEKPDESVQRLAKATAEHIDKKEPSKDCKIVKHHQDFIYKKNILQKPEKSQSMNDQSKPSSKRECSRRKNEVPRPISRNQSKTMSLRSLKNSSTVEMLKKKERCCKRSATPNKSFREKEDVMSDERRATPRKTIKEKNNPMTDGLHNTV